jgi:hypothetical protein
LLAVIVLLSKLPSFNVTPSIITPLSIFFSFIVSIDNIPSACILPVSPSINNLTPLLFFNSKSVKEP